MISKRITSFILVFIQFSCIGYFLFTGRFHFFSYFTYALLLIALALGVYAIICMQWKNFSVMPEPKNNSILISKGPYQFIRHPMYTSVLLFCASFVMTNFSYANIGIYCILTVDLIIKIKREEKYLLQQFPQYANYCMQTKQLIPFIW